MLSRLELAQQTWGGVNSAIDNWLSERQQVLVNYCKLAGLPPFEEKKGVLPSKQVTAQFCELLVDYVSAGHFEVYDKIVANCELTGELKQQLAKTLYPRIGETTQAALEFNDRYADGASDDELMEFDKDLAALGHALEARFELEDQLIATLSVHREGADAQSA